MIAYFKYVSGDAFTLDSVPYTGMMNITDDIPLTGDVKANSSNQLTPTNTYISEIYSAKGNFDSTVNSTVNIEKLNVTPNTILDKTSILNMFSVLDSNNREIFRSKFGLVNEFTISDRDTRFYGVSATPEDTRLPDDEMLSKSVYTHIDPFSFSADFEFMDRVVDSSITILEDSSFRYYVTTDTSSHVLSGALNINSKLVEIVGASFSPSSKFIKTRVNNVLYSIDGTDIYAYDLDVYEQFDKLILVDHIKIPETVNTSYDIKIGNQLFGFVAGDSIILHDTSSGLRYAVVKLSDIGISTLLDFDVRIQDDALVVLGTDSIVLIDTGLIHNSLEASTVLNSPVIEAADTLSISFSRRDSNVVYLVSNDTMHHRFLSNPVYPVTNSNFSDNLKFLHDYIFGSTEERFSKIQIKFNSNYLKSNYPNLLNVVSGEFGNDQYMILHFIGRLYTIPFTNSTSSSDGIGTVKNYSVENVGVCNNSYLGLGFNMIFRSILDDTINLYNNYSQIKTVTNDSLIFNDSIISSTIADLNSVDFSIHENESLNMISVNRVINNIYNIQKSLADDINSSGITE